MYSGTFPQKPVRISEFVMLVNTGLPPDRRIYNAKFLAALAAEKFKITVIQFGPGEDRIFDPNDVPTVAAYFLNPDPPGRKGKYYKKLDPFTELLSPVTQTPLGALDADRELDAWVHASLGQRVDWNDYASASVPAYSRNSFGIVPLHQECMRQGIAFHFAANETAGTIMRNAIAWLYQHGKEWSQREAAANKDKRYGKKTRMHREERAKKGK